MEDRQSSKASAFFPFVPAAACLIPTLLLKIAPLSKAIQFLCILALAANTVNCLFCIELDYYRHNGLKFELSGQLYFRRDQEFLYEANK
jgi:hypothetical protein